MKSNFQAAGRNLVMCLGLLAVPAGVRAQVSLPPVITIQPTNTSVGNAGGVLSVTFTGVGPFTYAWYANGTNLVSPGGAGLALCQVITTEAGNGGNGAFGDGGAAAQAMLNYPDGVAVDGAGNVFIADTLNQRVRKVDVNGIISTVAGNGKAGFAGDGGGASGGELQNPTGVAVDGQGDLFIADGGNERIREVNTNGILTTVAGDGTAGDTGDGGAATNAAFRLPKAVAVDGTGDLFITDSGNQRIRRVGANGVITTVAGNGTNGYAGDGGPATLAELSGPSGVAVDGAGRLWIADTVNQRIRRVDPNGVITTVAGNGTRGYAGDGGAATGAELGVPTSVAVNGLGQCFIADSNNQRVREVDTNGIIGTLAGDGLAGFAGDRGPATNAELNTPAGVAVDGRGNIFIADLSNQRIRQTAVVGKLTLTVSVGQAAMAGAYLVVIANAGGSVTSSVANVTVPVPVISAEPTNATVAADGNLTLSVAVAGAGSFTYAWYFNGAYLWPPDGVGPDSVITTRAGGGHAYPGDGGAATNAELWNPEGVAVDAAGNVFIADSSDRRIVEAGRDGLLTTLAVDMGADYAAPASQPQGLAVDGANRLYFADQVSNVVRRVDAAGVLTAVAGDGATGFGGDQGPAVLAELNGPTGVAVAGTGGIYVADSNNQRIRLVDTNGVITTVAGNGTMGYGGDGGPAVAAELNDPTGVAVDGTGDLFIADQHNQRIRKVDACGVITTVAGNGTMGYGGDGGPAVAAELNDPTGVAVDAIGQIFIADLGNVRIRAVAPGGIITTLAGDGTNGSVVIVTNGYAGGGELASRAVFNAPCCVAVDGAGQLFVTDQNNQRIRQITANSGPVLTLTNLQGDGVGGYSVVVTGPYGSVTSAVAVVTVVPRIPVMAPSSSAGIPGGLTLSLTTSAHFSSRILAATNLTPPAVWQPVYTNTTGGVWQFTDTRAPGLPARFYRVATP